MIGTYLAVALQPNFEAVSDRKEIKKNLNRELELIDYAVGTHSRGAFLRGGIYRKSLGDTREE